MMKTRISTHEQDEMTVHTDAIVTDLEGLAADGFPSEEIVSLLWLRQRYQRGGSDHVALPMSLGVPHAPRSYEQVGRVRRQVYLFQVDGGYATRREGEVMNSTLYMSTDGNSSCVHMDALLGEDLNATAVQPAYKPLDEEELHTSFEEAISDRLVALHSRLKHLSTSSLSSTHDPILPSTRPSVKTPVTQTATCPSSRLGKRWQRGITFIGLALMFTLLGFDLMGLLALHMR